MYHLLSSIHYILFIIFIHFFYLLKNVMLHLIYRFCNTIWFFIVSYNNTYNYYVTKATILKCPCMLNHDKICWSNIKFVGYVQRIWFYYFKLISYWFQKIYLNFVLFFSSEYHYLQIFPLEHHKPLQNNFFENIKRSIRHDPTDSESNL